MAHNGLSEFVKILESKDELVRFKEFVDPKFEIAEITDRFCKQPNGGKALLFENTGTQFPVLTNAFGSEHRMALALSMPDIDAVTKGLEDLFLQFTHPNQSLLNKVKRLKAIHKVSQWMPISRGGRGNCQQIIHTNPNLNILPVLTTWPFDGGPFITLPLVNTMDPISGSRNVEIYRMQVFKDNLTGMHWHRNNAGAKHFEKYLKRGEHMPIAVVLGGDPIYTFLAKTALPDYADKYLLAGIIRKQPVKLVKGITVDIEIPFDADIVIEGYIDPQEESVWEGPFGDQTGFYSLANWSTKFYVTCITHKIKAIYPSTVYGVPPMEGVYLTKATKRIVFSTTQLSIFPDLVDVYLPGEGAAQNISIVKISKTYPGQAYNIANALWGSNVMMFNKIMIVVSGDVNIYDPFQLALFITKHFNPTSDFLISRGPLDIMDHTSYRYKIGGKLLIDATEKLSEEMKCNEQYGDYDTEEVAELLAGMLPPVSAFNASLLSKGISLLTISVDKTEGYSVNELTKQLAFKLKKSLPKIILIVDKEFALDQLSMIVWYASGNIDPARDCLLLEHGYETVPCLVMDGTRKSSEEDAFPRDWPNFVVSNQEIIDRINSKWNAFGVGPLIQSPSARLISMKLGGGATVK